MKDILDNFVLKKIIRSIKLNRQPAWKCAFTVLMKICKEC